MGKEGKGWVKFHREQWEHWIAKDKPFDKNSAWTYLYSHANHKKKKTMINGSLIEIKRGQFITSTIKLSEIFGWSRGKVTRFLNDLKMDEMCNVNSTTHYTTITIINYEYYQSNEQQTIQQKDSRKTTKRQQKDTTKNVKNVKNVKNDKEEKRAYAEFVFLTEKEYQALIEKYGETKTKQFIEKLDNYKGATGKKYKNDYRAILNWVINEVLGKEKQNKFDAVKERIKKEKEAQNG